MAHLLADLLAEARLAARALVAFGQDVLQPTVRLGVTGLSRSGKTVFITGLVHGLIGGGRFPVFEPLATGRIARARLAPQPDDAVPRFDYEAHVRALTAERRWPESTDRISELRLIIDYQSQRGTARCAHRCLQSPARARIGTFSSSAERDRNGNHDLDSDRDQLLSGESWWRRSGYQGPHEGYYRSR